MQDYEIKNSELYDSVLSVTKILLEVISRRKPGDLFVTTHSAWKKQGENFYVKQQVQHTFWAPLIHKAIAEIQKAQEYMEFTSIVGVDQIISPQLDTLIGTCLGSLRFETINILFEPVYELIENGGGVTFDLQRFDAVYSKIEKALYADEIEFENVTPLCGFTMEDFVVPLSENVCIVKLNEKEISEFLDSGIRLGVSMGGSDIMHSIHEYALKISYQLPKIVGSPDNSDKGKDQFQYLDSKIEQEIVEALRIYKEGRLYPITTVIRSRSIFSLGSSFSFENPVKLSVGNNYHLLKSEVGRFISFWDLKTETPLLEKGYLSAAIRRFSRSNERDNIEDRIIDLMIAAESMFLSSDGDGSQGEFTYKLSHRAAMFLESDAHRQRKIFNFMKAAYDIRSKIVHGSNPKLPKKGDGTVYTLEEFCVKLEEYMRLSIKKVMSPEFDAEERSNKIDWVAVIHPIVN